MARLDMPSKLEKFWEIIKSLSYFVVLVIMHTMINAKLFQAFAFFMISVDSSVAMGI